MELSQFWWQVADIGFNVFHTFFIAFIMLGWVARKTRKAHGVALFLVMLSWLGLGYWFGWGYCFLTDWHWEIKKQVGENNLPASFISYLFQKILGLSLTDMFINILSVVFLAISVVMSVALNLRDAFKKKSSTRYRLFMPSH